MKYDNQLRYAVNIIGDYDGRTPLSSWLKEFYKANKQMGSSDRKTVSEMVYSYFRLGHQAFASISDRMLAAIALSHPLQEISEYFDRKDGAASKARLAEGRIFPWDHLLSEGIDADKLTRSFLIQPDLFIRVRPGKKDVVLQKLSLAALPFSFCGADGIRLPNHTRLEEVLDINRDVVVQDISSQNTGSLIRAAASLLPQTMPLRVWDCCAASGGKSIMAWDLLENIKLTVSDKRPFILHQLRQRFNEAGINKYESFVADLSANEVALPSNAFDCIIADVPCSGSGTWARTPEQLCFFTEEKLKHYSALQKQIAAKVVPAVSVGGALVYITCSVFRQENEEAAEFIVANSNLKLVDQQYFTGYENKADTLYGALFIN